MTTAKEEIEFAMQLREWDSQAHKRTRLEISSHYEITKVREAINRQLNNFCFSAGEMVYIRNSSPLSKLLDRDNSIAVGFSQSKDGNSFDGISVEFGSFHIYKAKQRKEYKLDQPHKPDSLPAAYYPNSEVIGQVVDDIQAWLFSAEVKLGDTFSKNINQGERDCEVVKVGRTRARIDYEMPNAGMMGGYIPIKKLFNRKLYCNEN